MASPPAVQSLRPPESGGVGWRCGARRTGFRLDGFFIEIDTQSTYFAGVTANPVGEWVAQQALNPSMTSVSVPDQSGSFSETVTRSSPPASTKGSVWRVSGSFRRRCNLLGQTPSPSARRDRSPRVPRSNPDPRSAPSRADPRRIHRPLLTSTARIDLSTSRHRSACGFRRNRSTIPTPRNCDAGTVSEDWFTGTDSWRDLIG